GDRPGLRTLGPACLSGLRLGVARSAPAAGGDREALPWVLHAQSSDVWGGVPATWGMRRGRGAVLAAGFGYRDIVIGRAAAAVGRILFRIRILEDIVGGSVMWLHSSSCGRLLDVGCGGGHFLARMRSLGWRVQGVEPDTEAVRVCQPERY